MRLTPKEKMAIQCAFQKVVLCSYQLYLFGSRVDDRKKGGDIDLLLILDEESKEPIIHLKAQIRQCIFESIPEQKIDITVATQSELVIDVFLENIMNQAILLDNQKASR